MPEDQPKPSAAEQLDGFLAKLDAIEAEYAKQAAKFAEVITAAKRAGFDPRLMRKAVKMPADQRDKVRVALVTLAELLRRD